jgi:mono/diheme cytochrome c family protein
MAHQPHFAAIALGLLGCSGSAADGATGAASAPAEVVSYYADAKVILDSHCVSCHRPGDIGPFALDSFESASAFAPAILDSIASGRMPPWPPDPSCNEYVGERRMSAAEIATVTAWVDGGAVEGDPKDTPPAAPSKLAELPRVDLELAMPEPYHAKGGSADEYRCFVTSYPSSTTRYVTGFEIIPGERAIVHHVIAFIVNAASAAAVQALDESSPGPGYPCFGTPGVIPSGSVGSWAPGGGAVRYPDSTGIPLDPGDRIVMQIHYSGDSEAGDATTLNLMLEDDVALPAMILPWSNPAWMALGTMQIPPHSSDVEHRFVSDPTPFMSFLFPEAPVGSNQPFLIHAANLHMHELGRRARLWIEQPNERCLLDIPQWQFQWQSDYFFKAPVTLRPGDQLGISCVYDNPTSESVGWGDATSDEMCLGGLYITATPP